MNGRMVLGISSFTYGWSVGILGNLPALPMDEIELVSIAVKSGVKCVQIGDNLPLHTFSAPRLTALRSLVQENNIRLELGARKLSSSHLQYYIELAVFFQSPLLRFVIDDAGYTPRVPEVIAIIRNMLPELKKHHITLGIENHDRLKAKEFANIVEAVSDTHVGICLDCANSLGAGEGLEEVSKLLAPLTVNLHLKDFTIQRLPHKNGFMVTGAPLGKGMTKVHELIDKVAAYDRCSSAIFEQWVTPEDSIEQTVQKERQWATEGIEYLKAIPHFNEYQKTN